MALEDPPEADRGEIAEDDHAPEGERAAGEVRVSVPDKVEQRVVDEIERVAIAGEETDRGRQRAAGAPAREGEEHAEEEEGEEEPELQLVRVNAIREEPPRHGDKAGDGDRTGGAAHPLVGQ